MSIHGLSLLAAAVTAASPASAARPDSHESLEFRLDYDSVSPVYQNLRSEQHVLARSSLGSSWIVQPNPRTGTLHAAYGAGARLTSAVTSEQQAGTLAQSFLVGQTALLGTRTDNMQLRNVRHWKDKYAVHFQQVRNGLPVHEATAWVLMDAAGNVGAFGSDFIPDTGEIADVAAVSTEQAVRLAADALGTTPRADRPTDVMRLYVPVGEGPDLTIAYRVIFESLEPFGKWVSTIHGVTGQVLARRNWYETINVGGTADGVVNNNFPTLAYCDGTVVEPLSGMTVSVQGGNSAVTDATGTFDIAHGGTTAVTVNAALRGPYIDVQNGSGGADASISTLVTPGVPATLSFSGANARQDEMTIFYQGNLIRDFMFGLDPTFTQLDVSMSSTAGNPSGVGFCPGNAWYTIGAITMDFCDATTSFGNTGEMSDVVYHEYGHGITEAIYVIRNGGFYPVGDVSEGNSDVVANFLDRNSVIGFGYFLNTCTSGIRDSNNNLQWPNDNDGGHFGGQIISGFHWDAWQSLLSAYPQATADQIAFDTWYFGRDLGTPPDQPSQVLWTFMADDDDANLSNGTPNYDHFCLAATNHGFTCPTIVTGVLIGHSKVRHTTDNTTSHDVTATITSTFAPLDPAELKVIYRVNGGADVELLMTATGNPNEYGATIPALPQGTEVEYYISAQDQLGNSETDPTTAPLQMHAFDIATILDDVEGDTSAWTTVDLATRGEWEAADPIGDAAQPEDDATGGTGTKAWITGQCGAPNCGVCTLGCNDVDGGTVALGTPVYDLTGALSAKLKYDRWFSNDQGGAPNTDQWLTRASNDGGATWTVVDATTTSNAAWTTVEIDLVALFGTPGLVQLRFTVSDQGTDSHVEAAVDDVRILADFGGPVDAEPALPAEPLTLSLEQNQPNPFRPATQIRFSIPTREDVSLVVYDVSGRAVRQLAHGVREPGRYTVAWNGLDGQGSRVAAGVYFYRLTAGSETLTRKMTVLK
jgi:hypothetical protein